MSAEWAGVLFTAAVAIVTGIWALYKWRRTQREEEREDLTKRDQDAADADRAIATSLVGPFLRACDRFQSRLYNLLCLRGLVPLRERFPRGEYAEETLYFAAQYFAQESRVLESPYGLRDQHLRDLVKHVQSDLASDREGVDAWCLFRERQRDLGRLIVASAENRDLETVSLLEFRERLDEEAVRVLGVREALELLKDVDIDFGKGIPAGMRLARVQTDLMELRTYLEQELNRLDRANAPLLRTVGRAVDCYGRRSRTVGR
jgi:hypothetical protein